MMGDPGLLLFFGEALVRRIQKLATGGRVETSNPDMAYGVVSRKKPAGTNGFMHRKFFEKRHEKDSWL